MNPNFTGTMLEYRVWKFPSGELGVAITSFQRMQVTPMTIVGSVQSSDHIMELLLLVNALRVLEGDAMPIHLVMPYCAYSRQDRVCNPGESLSIKVFAQLINSCNFASVACYDNHSDVSTALIKNCTSIDLWTIFEKWGTDNLLYDYLLSPDAGANKKVFKLAQELRTPMIRADKERNLYDGTILNTDVFMPTSKPLVGSRILVVDDIAANGGTFIPIVQKLHAIDPSWTVDLYVTHGFFHSGVDKLLEAGYNRIITTNSVCTLDHPKVKIIKCL